eukprot:Clim_evm53s225 gene=Clim_evmTU53s225
MQGLNIPDKANIALCAAFIALVFSAGIHLLFLGGAGSTFGAYLVALSSFHFFEFLVQAIYNEKLTSSESFLLNHSTAYHIAAVVSWTEFFVELWFFPWLKTFWPLQITGVVVVVAADIVRKGSMVHAEHNFTHIVQDKKRDDHKLVTTGIYSYCRHPSYAGFFWWSVGTQILLANPICVLAYGYTSWNFFDDRIKEEESHLARFFGLEYLRYRDQVSSGVPFIK